MTAFDEIFARAAERKGGPDALEAMLAAHAGPGLSPDMPDDRVLSAAAKCIFRSGFQWRVIEAKWPSTEQAFEGFELPWVSAIDAEQLAALLQDTRIVRHRGKVTAIVANAVWFSKVSAEHGSVAGWLHQWPTDDIVGLWDSLKKNGSHLGGASGARFLREVGKPTFVVTDSVTRALMLDGVVSKKPTGKGDLRKVQAAFNGWASESGRDLSTISRVLAYSVP